MATTVTGGIKPLTWESADGGATPTATHSTPAATITKSGKNVDLQDATPNRLPDELLIQLYMLVTETGTTKQSDSDCKLEAFALWPEGTATAKSIHTSDREADLVGVVTTGSLTIAAGTASTVKMGPSNVKRVPVKSRYLKLRYKATNVNMGTKVKFGYRFAPVYSQGYTA